MIRDLLDQKKVEAKLAAGGKATAQAAKALRAGDAPAVKLAKKYKVDPAQLEVAVERIEQALARMKKTRTVAGFMPRDPDASILQAALEQFYRELKLVEKPSKKRLAAE